MSTTSFMAIGDGQAIMQGLLTPRMAREMLREAEDMLTQAEADLVAAKLPHVPTTGTGMSSLDRIYEDFARRSHAGWIETCEARAARIKACVVRRAAALARTETVI